MKCRWYSDKRALAAYWKMGEDPRLSLYVHDLTDGKSVRLYDAPFFSFAWEDDILVGSDRIGYQNESCVVVFDKGTLALLDQEVMGEVRKVFSDDLRSVAHIRPDELAISAGSEQMSRFSLTANPTLRWSADAQQAAFIGESRRVLHLLDLRLQQCHTLRVGEDIPLPNGFTDLMYVWFLDNDDFILVEALCENGWALIFVSRTPERKSFMLQVSGECAVLSCSGSLVLYYHEDSATRTQELVSLDYLRETRKTVFTTKASITCADFSPDGSRILIGTYDTDHGNKLLILNQ